MTDTEFLLWLRDRLVSVYGESPNTDFVTRLEQIAATHARLSAGLPRLQARIRQVHAALTERPQRGVA